jgi:cobalt-zinc-cadmium resistance protein CzcA
VATYQKRLASELPKTDVSLMYGQYNGFYKSDNNITLSQGIPFPGVMIAKSALGSARIESASLKIAYTRMELIHQVKTVYYKLLYLKSKHQSLVEYDSIFRQIAINTDKRFQRGDGTLLEKTSAESRWLEVKNQRQNTEDEMQIQQQELALLLRASASVDVDTNTPEQRLLLSGDTDVTQTNPYIKFLKQQIILAEKEKNVSTNNSLPDFRIGYFNQSLYGVPLNDAGTALAGSGNRFQGVVFGLSFPLWFRPDIARVQAHRAQIKATSNFVNQEEQAVQTQYKQAVQQYIRAQRNLSYYTNTGLPNARLIRTQSERAYRLGEIGLTQHLFNLQQAVSIRENYHQTQHEYNQAIINIERYTSK